MYANGYNNPTAEELAAEVKAEAELREEIAREHEAEELAKTIKMLESKGFTVIPEEEL